MFFFSLLFACQNNPERFAQPELIAAALVPKGTYQIGIPTSMYPTDTLLSRQVTLTYDFLMAATELTIVQWQRVRPELPAQYCTDDVFHVLGRNHPVRCVSWCDAILFSNAVSQLDGLEPVYEVGGEFDWDLSPIQCNERAQFVKLNPKASGWRLPTEAEWEIAAHGALAQPNFEDLEKNREKMAWFEDTSGQKVHPVASLQPNELGLYDMSGNVFEWTWERFAAYRRTQVTDPFRYEVLIPQTYTRPIKGGSFMTPRDKLQIYSRANASPSLRHGSIGFRLVRTWNE